MTFRKNIQTFLTTFVIVLFSSCGHNNDSLVLTNNSNYTISVSETVPWADTLVNSIHYNLGDSISPNRSKTFPRGMNIYSQTWRIRIRDSKDKKLKLWIFNFDTLKKYKGLLTINQIAKSKLFDTVLVYTENQIDSMKYNILYSGRQK